MTCQYGGGGTNQTYHHLLGTGDNFDEAVGGALGSIVTASVLGAIIIVTGV